MTPDDGQNEPSLTLDTAVLSDAIEADLAAHRSKLVPFERTAATTTGSIQVRTDAH